jgi:hypothetical protein
LAGIKQVLLFWVIFSFLLGEFLTGGRHYFRNFASQLISLLLPELFHEEINLIQKRHFVVFPLTQLSYVILKNENGIYVLQFLEGYDLSTEITMEIELAFKLVFNGQVHSSNLYERDPDRLLRIGEPVNSKKRQ